MREGATIERGLPKTNKPTSKFKFKDFLQLINSVNPKKSLFLLGMLLSLVTSGASLIVPQLTKGLVDTSGLSKIDGKMLAVLILAFVIQLGFGTIGGFILRYVGESSVKTLREKLWAHLLRLPVDYFDDHKSGESSSRVVNDTSVIKDLITSQFPNFITGAIQLVGSMIILFFMDWKMASLMFSIVPIVVLILFPIGKIMARLGRKLQAATADFNADVSEKLSEVRLIKASNGEEFEKVTGRGFIDKIFKVGIKDAKVEAVLSPIMTTVMLGVFVGILGYGAVRIQQGTLSSGSLVAFLLYLFNIITPVASFATFFSQVQKAMGSTERIQEILHTEPEVTTTGEAVDVEGKEITAAHLNFSYDPDHQILHDVSFEAKPNTVVAFAGPSGGGKSTIFSLLERFYQPDNGSILIGEHDIKDIDLANWRSQIGYVSQDSAVFAGSIRENLQYGLGKKLTDEQLWNGLSLAYADGFVKDFPEQLDTQIGEHGVKLSGGQKQRIAIARAFLRDPKILMLDEATASLDSESEEKVQLALDQLMVGRTTLVIAHRLSTIVDADQIYFIEKGAVTGHGTHKELMTTHQLYKQYVNEQMVN
ncbi:ABC transporter ATP-binding protein [Companilactobacillus sp.]|jgi:ATP-binding cassette subfamily B protein AbcA/BmrA|uniref:ABC transporter ATP-binding protein n=1 Tax=Companilactobacillus sp. TaxID=2767905 RepID=UPI0025C10B2D|nr:ABC transporter ATP-binding protein [Companilactobacillus sp.]MCH4009001.1 ABC transporter ATP-binding protein/permease [Companilactobacillus sp.]MCH4050820.1 ABC transporter ATP-binding protein/permease [Companilactobacillus sp.]MCH4076943.1 ABC transporter ATP-binding protein/permease [Companilactobacillus sp.]MCH4125519.1 ABC transporter ATP-binding protein/permease [Companilactobacillus sp.]MCI1311228.1 ABC transporter ATP-binding protein/permease [Companilactobacillus sp.]